jgi:tetratricopeptide (TPR) repeat protein
MPQEKTPFHYAAGKLEARWTRLHRGDREPFPNAARVARAAKANRAFAAWVDGHGGGASIASKAQEAWRAFHAGDFPSAIELGTACGPLGASAANKAAGVHATYVEKNDARATAMLQAAIRRGEEAVELLPDDANAHYMLAFVLGRYSQRISILKALAEGHATKVKRSLERALTLEPKHADAHIALGAYHAEILGKVGGLAGRLTYGASQEAAIEHFEKACKLAPESAIARVEYADGLRLMDARKHAGRMRKLYEEAAAIEPADAMERLDCDRARARLASGVRD